ncbi:MAG: XdhC family protein [Dehalococcoidales bacterium]|nr:XdhC family protein [Dehalococcoidales bacterium]
MEGIFKDIVKLLSDNEDIAVATVVRTRGSTPREIGAKMLIRPSGAIIGTVGGGCGEAEVWRTALEVIHTRKPQTVDVDLTQEISLQSDGVCGGIMEVFVEAWSSGSEEQADALSELQVRLPAIQLAEAMVKSAEEKRPAALATAIACRDPHQAVEVGAKMIVFDDGTKLGSFRPDELENVVLDAAARALRTGEPEVVKHWLGNARNGDGRKLALADVEVFVEPFKPLPTLVIAGAGHIAVPLARMGKLLDFDVVVVDDRASFANEERFPDADRILVSDFESAFGKIKITSDSYVVLITRGHQHDVVSLKQVIDSDAAYIGMIGSRRRVWAVFKLLHEEGMPLEKLSKVYSPIGVDLAAETPAEIAVSIIAEVVKVRRGGEAPSLSKTTRERYFRLLREGKELE